MSEKLNQTQEKRNLTSIAYHKIKEAILLCKLKPGYCISGSQLAKQFNMSRTPIREAIQILAREDLVEIQKGAGFYVKGITLHELLEITEVRTALECMALRTSIHEVPARQVEALADKWRSARQRCIDGAPGTITEILELDTETHHLITHNCNNSYLTSLVEDISLRIIRIQSLSVDKENAVDTTEQHLAILEAMQRKDLRAAVALLERHIRYSPAYIAGHPDNRLNGELMGLSYLDDIFDPL